MDEVGYVAETLAREHREGEHGAGPTEEHSLMQNRKQLKRGAARRVNQLGRV